MKNVHKNIRNASITALILFLCLSTEVVDVYKGTSDYTLDESMAVIIVCGMIAIGLLYRAIVWQRNRNIRTYIKEQGSRMAAYEKVNYFLKNAPCIAGMQYDENFLCGQNFFGLEFAEVKKIKGYRKSKKIHKKYGIPTFKSNYLDLIMQDGKLVSLSFLYERGVNDAIKVLKKEYPNMKEYMPNHK